MAHSNLILNPCAVRCLASVKSSAAADCAGWLVRVVPGRSRSNVPCLDCCWFVLRGNILLYCDDPESPPKGMLFLENHCVELFDNFDDYEFALLGASKKDEPITSLKDYFSFLNISTASGDRMKKDSKKMLLSDVSLASSAMQFAFRVFFPESPTQEHFVFIADSDQSLQMWMRAIALAGYEARRIMAASKQLIVFDSADSPAKSKLNVVSSKKSFTDIHESLRQVVLNCKGQ